MSHDVKKTEPKFRRYEFELLSQQPEHVYIRPLDSSGNRPVEESADRSIDLSEDRSVDSSGDRSVHSSGDRSVDAYEDVAVDSSEERSVNSFGDRSVDPSEERPVDPSGDISVNLSGDRSVDPSKNRSVNSFGDRSVDPSEERPVDPSGDLSLNLSEDRSVDPSENRSVNSSDVTPFDVPASLSDVETFTARPDSLFSRACQNSLANNLMTFIMVLFIVGILLMLILLPLSLADLEYYEMGFVKNKITGSVDTEKVYYGGRHFIGLAKTFKIFPFNLHTERFPKVSIYNKEKIEVTLNCSLQYALKSEDLHLLHDIYDVSYRPVFRAVILATVKGAATQYTIEEYRLKRRVVEQGLSDAVAKSLGGNCCPPNCSNNECKDCIPHKNCSANEKGLFASLKYFHLQHISIPKQQESIFLRQVLEQEKKHTEVYIQQEMLMRKRTDEKRIAIEMLTKELSQVAVAWSSLITSKAQVAAEARLNAARNHGLNLVYSALNISEEEKKLSFDYLRTLTDSTKAKLFLDFQYMVAEP